MIFKKKPIKISWKAYASRLGWLDRRACPRVWFCENANFEEIQFKSSESPVSVHVWNTAGEQQTSDGVVGCTDSKKYLTAISICVPDYHIGYRIYRSGFGWSRFCFDGEKAGDEDAGIPLCGMQMIVFAKEADREKALEKAEAELQQFMKLKETLFLVNDGKMLDKCSHNYLLKDKHPQVRTVKKGIALPLITDKTQKDTIFLGGIVDEQYSFLAGMERKKNKPFNFSIQQGYQPEEPVEFCEETVIYGGVLIGHFGHLLTDCLAWAWYLIQNSKLTNRIIFFIDPRNDKSSTLFFELMGIPKERFLLIKKPMQFKRIIIPDQAFCLQSEAYPEEFLLPYDTIRSKIEPSPYKKVYLSRTRFVKQDGINEEFYESFFERRGYKVIEPEEFSIEEQIAFMKGAEEVVCTAGTLSHLALFCNEGTKLIILNRMAEHVLIPQIIMNQVRHLQVKFVDCTYNFLPMSYNVGPFLYGPTDCFRDFLRAGEIPYDSAEMEFDLERFILPYLSKWAELYHAKGNMKRIENLTMSDLVKSIDRTLLTLEDSDKTKN